MKVKFWYKTRRGASGSKIVEFPGNSTDYEIKEALDSWAESQTCDLDSVNYRYGFEELANE